MSGIRAGRKLTIPPQDENTHFKKHYSSLTFITSVQDIFFYCNCPIELLYKTELNNTNLSSSEGHRPLQTKHKPMFLDRVSAPSVIAMSQFSLSNLSSCTCASSSKPGMCIQLASVGTFQLVEGFN